MIDSDEGYLIQTENRHLKNTIVALRDELEKINIRHKDNVQQTLASANDEIKQLKATIFALRDELENNRNDYEEKIQDIHRAARDEMKQLQQTISILRDRMEAYEKK